VQVLCGSQRRHEHISLWLAEVIRCLERVCTCASIPVVRSLRENDIVRNTARLHTTTEEKARLKEGTGRSGRKPDLPFWLNTRRVSVSGVRHPADVVDHIIPHRGNQKLFWDTKNWQAMNHVCHNRKTAREDGGFGNRSRN